MSEFMRNCLFETLYEAEQAFRDAVNHSEQYAAAEAWLAIADILQKRGDMEVHI
ncbi:hypothetical protein ACGE24_03945 [Corynebacterium kroppenstedtii]|uniref:hypothetical protein n=1 Tax=Corynebacterium sp. PCR 32 TaxID=3351342 RepID=UPI0030B3DA7E